MPWSGGAFLVGALAIARMLAAERALPRSGADPQALLHVPAYAGVWDGTLGALALAALAGTMALAVLCFVKVIGLVLLGPPRRSAARGERPAAPRSRGARALAGACVVLGALPACSCHASPGSDRGAPGLPVHPGLDLPGTG